MVHKSTGGCPPLGTVIHGNVELPTAYFLSLSDSSQYFYKSFQNKLYRNILICRSQNAHYVSLTVFVVSQT